jgi:hypothetical protein
VRESTAAEKRAEAAGQTGEGDASEPVHVLSPFSRQSRRKL